MSVSTELWSCDCAITCLVVMWLCHYLLGGHVTVPLPSWWSCDCAITFLVVMWLCHYLLGGHVTVPLPAWWSCDCAITCLVPFSAMWGGISAMTLFTASRSVLMELAISLRQSRHHQHLHRHPLSATTIILQNHHCQHLHCHPLSAMTHLTAPSSSIPLSSPIINHHYHLHYHPTVSQHHLSSSPNISHHHLLHHYPLSATITHHHPPPATATLWIWGVGVGVGGGHNALNIFLWLLQSHF